MNLLILNILAIQTDIFRIYLYLGIDVIIYLYPNVDTKADFLYKMALISSTYDIKYHLNMLR